MFPIYSRLLDRIDKLEQRLAEKQGEDASPNTPDPQTLLNHIAEVSKNARATWFGLLGLLAFVGVTLLAHKDADFFAHGAETQLPLIGITVPVKAFFYTAPILVAALYMYLHLYLLNLWDALAQAPARIDNQPLGDRVFPWLISHAALWHRNRTRIGADGEPEGSTSPRPMGRFVVFISLTLGAVFGILVLGLLWLRSMPAHDEWLTLWIARWLFLATLVGITGLVSAARRMAGVSRHEVSRSHGVRRGYSIAFALTLAFLSWETTEGGILNHRITNDDGSVEWAQIVSLYPANLREAELTRKPPGWLPWHLWREDFQEKFRKREGIAAGGELPDEHKPNFEKEAKERYAEYTAQLDAPDLRGADLRNADMAQAFLPGADLRFVEMQGAKLYGAQMQGAKLFWAKMQGADLNSAQMQGAVLSGAEMQGAKISLAQMQEADLNSAQMQGAVLSGAEMQGAVLRGAEMKDANCRSATLRGALLQFADVTCLNLTQQQLEAAVGDSDTTLPDGLTVASCLKALPQDVETALAHHPEEGDPFRRSRADIRDALLCGPDEDPVRFPLPTPPQQ